MDFFFDSLMIRNVFRSLIFVNFSLSLSFLLLISNLVALSLENICMTSCLLENVRVRLSRRGALLLLGRVSCGCLLGLVGLECGSSHLFCC